MKNPSMGELDHHLPVVRVEPSMGEGGDGHPHHRSPDVNANKQKQGEKRPLGPSRLHQVVGDNDRLGEIKEKSYVPNTQGPRIPAVRLQPAANQAEEDDIFENCRRSGDIGIPSQTSTALNLDGRQEHKNQYSPRPCMEGGGDVNEQTPIRPRLSPHDTSFPRLLLSRCQERFRSCFHLAA